MTSPDENKSQGNMPKPPPTKPLSEKRKAAWAALAADMETVAMIQRRAKESTHFVPTVQENRNARDQDGSQKKGLTVQPQFQKDLEFLYGDRVLEKLGIKIDENGEASKAHEGGKGKGKTKERDEEA